MLYILMTAEHTYTHECLLSEKSLSFVRIITYTQLFNHLKTEGGLPPGSYLFTDMDRLSPRDAINCSNLYRQLAAQPELFKLFNNPAKVKNRYGLLRALYKAGLNSFNVYRMEELANPERFPVFIRFEAEHERPYTDLLHSQDELDDALKNVVDAGNYPQNGTLITEYCGEALPEGIFRRLSAYRIGERILPAISVFEDHWCVKYGKSGIVPMERYRTEHALLNTQPYPHAKHLRKVFDIAQIQYGRADFAIVNGKVEVYEINTNPHIKAYDNALEHPSPSRLASRQQIWESYLSALRELDC